MAEVRAAQRGLLREPIGLDEDLTLRPLGPEDLPLLRRWFAAPHVAAWWGEEGSGVGARPGELGIDYLIGEAELIGRGLGPRMLRVVLAETAHSPGLTGVRVDVAEANRRSWRCLERLGFRRERSGVSVSGEPGPHFVYVLGGVEPTG